MKLNTKKETGDKTAIGILEKVNYNAKMLADFHRGLPQYLIYDNKIKTACCTYCGKVIPGKFKHNSTCRCPKCKHDVVAKSKGLLNKEDYKYLLTFHKAGQAVVSVVTLIQRRYYAKDFTNFTRGKAPKLTVSACALYYFSQDKQDVYFNYDWGGWGKGATVCVKGGLENEDIQMHERSFNCVVEKSHLKYVKDIIYRESYLRNGSVSWCLKTMNLYSKHPQTEYLWKMGFHQVVEEKIWRLPNFRAINWKGKTIMEMLKLPKEYIKILQNFPRQVTHQDLALLQRCKKEGQIVRATGEFDKILRWINLNADKVPLKHTTVKKLNNYKLKHLNDGRFPQMLYDDYLRQAKMLEYDLNDAYYLFPRNIRTAHDKVSEEYREMQEKEKERQRLEERKKHEAEKKVFGKIVDGLKKYSYQNETLLIRPAEGYEEIQKEGAALHHCVASYYTGMLKKQTAIFVVRQVNAMEVPYYTLELKNGQIVQCRGKCNHSMTDEVQDFVDGWHRMIVSAKKKKERRQRK